MRKAPKSEQEQAEIAAAERKDQRKSGFELMHVRDRGWGTMSNGVTMLWHVDEEKRPMVYDYVPDNHFALVVEGKKYLFDGEEFRRWLRWV